MDALQLQSLINETEGIINTINSFLQKKNHTTDELNDIGTLIDSWSSQIGTVGMDNSIENMEIQKLNKKLEHVANSQNDAELQQVNAEKVLKLKDEFKEILQDLEIKKLKEKKNSEIEKNRKKFNDLKNQFLKDLGAISWDKTLDSTDTSAANNVMAQGYIFWKEYTVLFEKYIIGDGSMNGTIMEFFSTLGINKDFINNFTFLGNFNIIKTIPTGAIDIRPKKQFGYASAAARFLDQFLGTYRDENKTEYLMSVSDTSIPYNNYFFATDTNQIMNAIENGIIIKNCFKGLPEDDIALLNYVNDSSNATDITTRSFCLLSGYKPVSPPDKTILCFAPYTHVDFYTYLPEYVGYAKELIKYCENELKSELENKLKYELNEIDKNTTKGGGFEEIKKLTANALWEAIIKLRLQMMLKQYTDLLNKYQSNLVNIIAAKTQVTNIVEDKKESDTSSELLKPLQNYLQYQMKSINKHDEAIAKLGYSIGLSPNVILGIYFATHKKDIIELLNTYAPQKSNYAVQFIMLKKQSARYALRINWGI